MIADTIQKRAEWVIDILERTKRIIEKEEKDVDHSKNFNLRRIKTKVDTALLLTREALQKYNRRKRKQ